MSTDLHITDAERAALRTALDGDDARIDQAVRWAIHAGYDRSEVAGVIFTAAAEASKSRVGRKPKDALRARICARSPRDCARAGRFLRSALLQQATHHWRDLAGRRKARSAHEVANECRTKVRGGGQGGFCGLGWALPTDPEGEPA